MSSKNVDVLNDPSIAFVRVQWHDLSAQTRIRVYTMEHFKKLLQHDIPSVSIAVASLGLIYLNLAKGFSSTGEWLYVLDLKSLRPCGYAPGQASVMGFFQLKDTHVDKPISVAVCPRGVLANALNTAESMGIQFRVGFETEFILLHSVEPLVAANTYGWHESNAIQAGTKVGNALEEIAKALQASNVGVEMYHSEAAPGQYEIVTSNTNPMDAADGLVTTREVLRNVAAKYGMIATLSPRVYANSCGSAGHMHFSLKGKSEPLDAGIDGAPDMSTLDASFLETLLEHLPAVCAFTLPTKASYLRMVDGVWSGGTYICWGRDSRESPVRLAGSSPNYHFELRCIDGTSNPYITIAAVIQSGLLGVKKQSKLTTKHSTDIVSGLSDLDRAKLGVKGRLPLSIAQAREALQADKELHSALGDEFVTKWLSVNDTLNTVLHKGDAAQVEKALIEMY